MCSVSCRYIQLIIGTERNDFILKIIKKTLIFDIPNTFIFICLILSIKLNFMKAYYNLLKI